MCSQLLAPGSEYGSFLVGPSLQYSTADFRGTVIRYKLGESAMVVVGDEIDLCLSGDGRCGACMPNHDDCDVLYIRLGLN